MGPFGQCLFNSHRHIPSAILINATTGRPLDIGHRLTNKNLALTLRNVSVNGPETLSVGHFAEALALEIRDGGGIVTARDFGDFEPVVETPLTATLSDSARLYTVPLPSGGTLLAYASGIIDKFRDSGGRLPDNEHTWHRMVEAVKFGFGKRPSFRDPYADDLTEKERQALLDAVKSLLMPNVTKAIAAKIRNRPQPDPAFYGLIKDQIRDHGSGQLCVIGPNGDAFALTSSINTEFGALFLSHHTGIWMNNVMNDFSTPYADNVYGLPSAYANYIAARKRPMSSLAPSIVVDAKGDVVLAITSTGSGNIGSGILQVLARILWMGHTVKEAIDCGRLHNQLYPDEVRYESILDNDVLDGLRRRGHKTIEFPWEGNVIAVARDARTNLLNGSYDYRNQSSGGVDGGD